MTAGRTRTVRGTAAVCAAVLAATGLAGCHGSGTAAKNSSAHGSPRAGRSAAAPTASPRTPSAMPTLARPSTSGSPSATLRTTGGLPPVLSRIPTRDKVVFITIDDGWEKDADFAAYVRRHHVPVTVFLLNAAAKGHYDYFRGLQSDGALIEDHTMTHPLLTRLGYAQQKQQICRTAAIYAREFGVRPSLFRAPYGAVNRSIRRAAKACGMKAIFFWREVSQHGDLEYQTPGGLKTGDIILVHFEPHMLRDFKTLLRRIAKQGFEPGVLSDYLPRAYLTPTAPATPAPTPARPSDRPTHHFPARTPTPHPHRTLEH